MTWQARRDGLIITETSEDLVVYDQDNHTIHHLNPLAACIWRRADPQMTEAALLAEVKWSIDLDTDAATLESTLSQLANAGLITGDATRESAVSRRRFLRRTAIGGIAIPAVISVTAPMAAQAASTACATPPAPNVVLGLRPSGDLNYTLFIISISGFCPLTTYPANLQANRTEFWNGIITTDESGSAVIEPSPSFSCSSGAATNRFWGEVNGVSSSDTGIQCP